MKYSEDHICSTAAMGTMELPMEPWKRMDNKDPISSGEYPCISYL